MLILLSIAILLAIVTFFYMQHPKFGALPKGKHLELIQQSPNYKDGKFQNLVDNPEAGFVSIISKIVWERLTKTYPNVEPTEAIPSVKNNLKQIPLDSNVIVWFGHSSFYLQLDSVKILVDPVFSGNASPILGSTKAFKGSDVYSVNDMPEIDYMLLSHDHWDHLDYETAKALQTKVKYVICGLGNGAHYAKWGYTAQQIIEKDWGETVSVKPEFNIYVESTHHTSGRGFARAKSLWASFYIQSSSLNIYCSGDGGYSNRFQHIAEKYPPIDWAIMECGQYNKLWHPVHEFPEEVALATAQLKAKNLLPVHHSKFQLSTHPWFEPLDEITKYSIGKHYRLATPMIGEMINLNDTTQPFSQWWKKVK